MATHMTCDGCGGYIDRNYTGERFKPELEIGGVRFRVEVMVTSNVRHGGMVSNQGEICLPCLKRVLMEGGEVAIKPPAPKIPPLMEPSTERELGVVEPIRSPRARGRGRQ